MDEPSGSCPVCWRRDPRWPPVCDLCRHRLAARLWEVRDLHALLLAALEQGQGAQQRVSGSREVPVPLRLEPVDLAGPARQDARPLFARGLLGLDPEQVGSLSVATILQTRALEWAQLLGVVAPEPEVPTLVSWLSRNLYWALQEYDEVEFFASEVTALVYSLRALLSVSRKPIYLKGEACPSCGRTALKRDPGGGDVECGHCRNTWPFAFFAKLAVDVHEETVAGAA